MLFSHPFSLLCEMPSLKFCMYPLSPYPSHVTHPFQLPRFRYINNTIKMSMTVTVKSTWHINIERIFQTFIMYSLPQLYYYFIVKVYVLIGTDFGPLMSDNLYVILVSVTAQYLRDLLYTQLLNVQPYIEVHYGTSSLISVLAVSLYLAVSSPFLPHSLSSLCYL